MVHSFDDFRGKAEARREIYRFRPVVAAIRTEHCSRLYRALHRIGVHRAIYWGGMQPFGVRYKNPLFSRLLGHRGISLVAIAAILSWKRYRHDNNRVRSRTPRRAAAVIIPKSDFRVYVEWVGTRLMPKRLFRWRQVGIRRAKIDSGPYGSGLIADHEPPRISSFVPMDVDNAERSARDCKTSSRLHSRADATVQVTASFHGNRLNCLTSYARD